MSLEEVGATGPVAPLQAEALVEPPVLTPVTVGNLAARGAVEPLPGPDAIAARAAASGITPRTAFFLLRAEMRGQQSSRADHSDLNSD